MTSFEDAYNELIYRMCHLQNRLDACYNGRYRIFMSKGVVGFGVFKDGVYVKTLPELGDVAYELLAEEYTSVLDHPL